RIDELWRELHDSAGAGTALAETDDDADVGRAPRLAPRRVRACLLPRAQCRGRARARDERGVFSIEVPTGEARLARAFPALPSAGESGQWIPDRFLPSSDCT